MLTIPATVLAQHSGKHLGSGVKPIWARIPVLPLPGWLTLCKLLIILETQFPFSYLGVGMMVFPTSEGCYKVYM